MAVPKKKKAKAWKKHKLNLSLIKINNKSKNLINYNIDTSVFIDSYFLKN